ncbi:hypothetical protein C8R47DRAFT_1076758 [Mycena vitilis]|nr:hypothetical protein C8R47DRAFT_1076758 [Mycena vitilis]
MDEQSKSNPVDRAFFLTWGFQFIAYTLDAALWGVAMVLVLQYFRNYARRDPVSIQTVVGSLGLLTTNHFIFYAIENYKNFVSLYGDLEAEDAISYAANVSVSSFMLHTVITQNFEVMLCSGVILFDWRDKGLSNRRMFSSTPVEFGFIAALSYPIHQVTNRDWRYVPLVLPESPISSTQSGATFACDVTITAILCAILRKSRTGIRRQETDSVVDKMLIYALNRGAMTSLWALLQLIFFVGMPGTFVFQMFIVPSSHRGFPLPGHDNSHLIFGPQVYVISVCSMLISRESLRAELKAPDGIVTSFPLTSVDPSFGREAVQPSGNIHVGTSVIRWMDHIPDPDQSADNSKTEVGLRDDSGPEI